MRVNFSSKTCGPSLRTVQYTIEGSNTFRSAPINGGEVTLWVISVDSISTARPLLLRSLPKCRIATNVERGQ